VCEREREREPERECVRACVCVCYACVPKHVDTVDMYGRCMRAPFVHSRDFCMYVCVRATKSMCVCGLCVCTEARNMAALYMHEM